MHQGRRLFEVLGAEADPALRHVCTGLRPPHLDSTPLLYQPLAFLSLAFALFPCPRYCSPESSGSPPRPRLRTARLFDPFPHGDPAIPFARPDRPPTSLHDANGVVGSRGSRQSWEDAKRARLGVLRLVDSRYKEWARSRFQRGPPRHAKQLDRHTKLDMGGSMGALVPRVGIDQHPPLGDFPPACLAILPRRNVMTHCMHTQATGCTAHQRTVKARRSDQSA